MGREDFRTQYSIPTGTCDCTESQDFHEKSAGDAAVPRVVSCAASPPKSDFCPTLASGSVCEDHIKDSAGCKWGGMCDCATLVAHKDSTGCGGVFKSTMGNVQIDDVCAKYCGCGSGSPSSVTTTMGMGHGSMSMGHGSMSMGCGNTNCDTSKKFIAENAVMHTGMAVEFTCDVPLDFVRGMLPHHLGAVKMCDVLLAAQASTDVGLVHFCLHVQQEQTIEGQGMLNWLGSKGKDKGKTCGDGSMGCGNLACQASKEWVAANHRMHEGMAIKFTCDAQVDFVRGMIPHHVAAIEMCEILVMFGSPPDAYLSELCDNITRVQRAEVMYLNEWLVTAGHAREARCKDGPPSPAPCEDLLLISEACHHLGGDGACRCGKLIQDHACGTTSVVNQRTMNVTDHCLRTCGACPARPASVVGSAKDHHHHHHHDPPEAASASCPVMAVAVVAAVLAAFSLP